MRKFCDENLFVFSTEDFKRLDLSAPPSFEMKMNENKKELIGLYISISL